MKILRLSLLLLTLTIGFSSCSKDDEVSTVSGNKYETTLMKFLKETEGSETTIVIDSKEKIIEADMYNVFEFKKDGNVFLEHLNAEGVSEGENWFGNWEQNDSKIILKGGQELELNIDGNKLKYTGNIEGEMLEMHFTKM